jgi:MEMO1 family protein
VTSIRPPAVAGSFYPVEPSRLISAVDGLLARATPEPSEHSTPLALVAPHAGYRYSGPIAASAFTQIRERPLSRVAIAGPAHFVPMAAFVVPSASAWRTPLGDVPIDDELRSAAVTAGAVVDDAPHRREHAVEVQLPFLQRIAGSDLIILPVAVGPVDAEEAARLLGSIVPLVDLLVISTDLSHYLTHAGARATDTRTAEAVVRKDATAIDDTAACGVHALRGLVELARQENLEVRLLDLRTSADTYGHDERVVGYGAFAVGSVV